MRRLERLHPVKATIIENFAHESRLRHGPWSTPSFHREAVVLQTRYERFFHRVDPHEFRSTLEAIPRFIYRSEDLLSDGYRPYATFVYRVPGGKIAVSFPRFAHTFPPARKTERWVAIYHIGHVTPHDAIDLSDRILLALPPFVAVEEGGSKVAEKA